MVSVHVPIGLSLCCPAGFLCRLASRNGCITFRWSLVMHRYDGRVFCMYGQ